MTRRYLATRSAVLGVAVALFSLSTSTGVAINNVTPVLQGLDGPRGLAVGPGDRLVYGETSGAISELIVHGHNAGTVSTLNSVPGTYIAPAVATYGGNTFVLTAGGEPGSGSNTLYRVTNGQVVALADIAAYQVTDPDPDNTDGPPDESNPFGVAALPDGSVLVSDAAANDLLRVFPNGRIVTVARLKPRVVQVPAGLPPPPDFPPAGVPINAESVATSVTVGADGYYYLGELRGFPSPVGKSQVWRIAPNSVNAVCDPLAPATGACRRYADGFTSIVDLAAGADGSIYVVELVKQGWLQWELGLVDPPIGGVFRIPPGGGTTVELAPNQLILPAGIAVTNGAVYVTSPVFGPGSISRIQ